LEDIVSESKIEPVACECGESETVEVEHSKDHAGEMRIACPCGISGPCEFNFDNCYSSWNDQQRALKHFDAHEVALHEIKKATNSKWDDMPQPRAWVIADDALKSADLR
jgi:hypothetical protein